MEDVGFAFHWVDTGVSFPPGNNVFSDDVFEPWMSFECQERTVVVGSVSWYAFMSLLVGILRDKPMS